MDRASPLLPQAAYEKLRNFAKCERRTRLVNFFYDIRRTGQNATATQAHKKERISNDRGPECVHSNQLIREFVLEFLAINRNNLSFRSASRGTLE